MTTLSAAETKRRKAYGRGLYEGLRAAGIDDPRGFMNNARIERIESGLNSLAKKILEAVPCTEPWTKEQIKAELYRQGHNVPLNVMLGALDRMREQGLIREPRQCQFVRVQGRQNDTPLEAPSMLSIAPPAPEPPPPPPPAPPAPDKPKEDVFARLARMAVALRAIADEAEAIALDAEDRMQMLRRDTEKLRQFQALLKSLGND